ncbi:MAG: alpha-amylase family glycosyl hydrolase [Candidatus Hermodarchaeota archaeon]
MFSKNLKWSNHPKILEINTWPWLNEVSSLYGSPITLKDIPTELIKNDFKNFDVIWLMGVWERSPRGREIAKQHPDLQTEFHNSINNFNSSDVVGSPYAVYFYHVDKNIGGNEGLESFRKELSDNNQLLILDYVPNHVAVDHMWTLIQSDIFIKGTEEDLITRPNEYFNVIGQVYAHGRDPYFPPWTDTIQINAFSYEAREKSIFTLLEIAELCDGVRCDMAMLMINEIFSRTWGERAGAYPEKEFWVEIIDSIRNVFPTFKFLAEVYWGMEWKLQRQGFDFCYDKTLYDRIIHDNAQSIIGHLQASWNYQTKLVRYIENHDEKRVIRVLGEDKSKAAAILILTLPGARLINEGQTKGYKIKLPIQLGRRTREDSNFDLLNFYNKLLNSIPKNEFDDAQWKLCYIDAIDLSSMNLIAYQWDINDNWRIVVVNFSPITSRGHIRIKNIDFGDQTWEFTDILTENKYLYKGENLKRYGLYIELSPWNGHIFSLRREVL